MDEALLGIVKNGNGSIDINEEELKRHTKRYDYQEITSEQWKQVRHLHVILSFRNIVSGCYISPDGSWVLIYNMPSEMVCNGIAKCGERLELLNIIGRVDFRIDFSLKNQ